VSIRSQTLVTKKITPYNKLVNRPKAAAAAKVPGRISPSFIKVELTGLFILVSLIAAVIPNTKDGTIHRISVPTTFNIKKKL
jgi:hypothetical protein